MKLKKIIIPLFLFLIAGTLISYTLSDNERKDKFLLGVIFQTLNYGHYQPAVINDEFSKKAYKLYLERLDKNKIFLLQEDVSQFKKYINLIDDETKQTSYDFFNLSNDIIEKRIDEAVVYYKDALSKPFDFKKNETIELDGDKKDYNKDKAELKESWRKAMKFQTMISLADMLKAQEQAKEKKDTSVEIKSYAQLEEDARNKILKRQDDWFRRMEKVNRNDRLSLYLNCMVNVFDPHTGYFPPKDKENFDIAMSGKLEGIGATLQEKDGYIKVVRIVVGSASWKQKELKAGDLIIKVAQGEDEAVDIIDMRLDEAVKLIRGPKGTKVRLTVKKIDGSIIEIPIIRDVVIIEETYAKSAIVKDEDNKANFGYIKLPKFYVDFNDRNGRRCSEDVKKEVEKLKEENVKGIIIDLRNNGGGSLPDVVKIVGHFIDVGPVVQIKTRYGNPQILSDDEKGIIYDGPLVIMVNTFSASASEIMAAAIQDYKRGVIVGSNITFGKGTVQRFFDLDNVVNTNEEGIKPLGALKITTQKFYRINGGATQLKGVSSDIILPDLYSYIDIGEKEMENTLPWSQIDKVPYKRWTSTYDLNEIQKNSNARIKANSTFSLVNTGAEYLKKQSDKTKQTLVLVKYRQEQKEIKENSKKIEDVLDKPNGLNIFSLALDLPDIKSDSIKLQRAEEWHKELKKDIYLKEAFSVLNEMK